MGILPATLSLQHAYQPKPNPISDREHVTDLLTSHSDVLSLIRSTCTAEHILHFCKTVHLALKLSLELSQRIGGAGDDNDTKDGCHGAKKQQQYICFFYKSKKGFIVKQQILLSLQASSFCSIQL